jgi:hypothetical protein
VPVTTKIALELKPKHAHDACYNALNQTYLLAQWNVADESYFEIVGHGRYRVIDKMFPFQIEFKIAKGGKVNLNLWADTSNSSPLDGLADAVLKYEQKFLESLDRKLPEEQNAIRVSAYDGVAFMSYARADYKFADKLRRDLFLCELEVWLDQDYLRTGETWTDEIESAIEKADVFVLVISPEALTSKWVPRELAHAQKKKRPILPVVHTEITHPDRIQKLIGNIETADLGKGKYRRGLLELVDVIKSKTSIDAQHQGIYEAFRDSLSLRQK